MLLFLLAVAVIGLAGFSGFQQASSKAKGQATHSRPIYHAVYRAMWVAFPLLLVASFWLGVDSLIIKPTVVSEISIKHLIDSQKIDLVYLQITQAAKGYLDADYLSTQIKHGVSVYNAIALKADITIMVLMIIAAGFGFYRALSQFSPQQAVREDVEKVVKIMLAACSSVAVLTTAGIVFALIFETLQFFQKIPIFEFIFGTHWSPQMAIREDQVGSSGAFGVLPLFAGTLLIAGIAMLIAVPIGLFSAIYLAEYAHPKVRTYAKPALEVLAGIPTVVYGFFAALTVAPLIVKYSGFLGLTASAESALAAGLVMGVMIIPFVSSLSEDVISAVPQSLRDGSLALGATKAETIRKVVLPAALAGIVSSLLLAFSRAVGETMIVVMAAGLAANMTANPLESVTTITAQIVTILVGDQSFDSAKTLAAFALGLSLFVFTLVLNIIALKIVRKYREHYE